LEEIRKIIEVRAPVKDAFEIFARQFQAWWPQEYTWSQEKLVAINIGCDVGMLCTEIGPDGFRCDWGRITVWQENKKIGLKWQIGPKREPVPDPQRASDLSLEFNDRGSSATEVVLKHTNFENHGKGAAEYRNMIDSKMGWDYILDAYRQHCNA